MLQFHFHLWQAGNCLLDVEGVELPDRDAAVTLARCTLGESLADDLEAGREPVNRCIVIADSRGLTLAQLSTSELLTFKGEEPACPSEPELELT